jgi:hypothetical protein
MRLEVPQGTTTYLLASFRRINAVDHWTVGGVADPLKNGCLPRICFFNNKDSELDVAGESGEVRWYPPFSLDPPLISSLIVAGGRNVHDSRPLSGWFHDAVSS